MLAIPFAERVQPLPRTFPLTVIARDPRVTDRRSSDPARQILVAEVPVPASRLEPGPRGPRFHVVDFNASTGKLGPATNLAPGRKPAPGWGFRDRFRKATDRELLESAHFRAQNVYAVAARTLASFEFALGRPIPWAFGAPQLYLVPTAFAEPNAFYADDDQALYFGYFPDGEETVYTALAHDIVAHETTHAILDGLRRRFDTPALPDQAGFHEGISDVVALLSLLSSPASTGALLGDPTRVRIDASSVTEDRLKESVLFTLGKEFGDALHLNRGGGLRRSVTQEPTKEWRDPTRREWDEPHRRGEIFAAAVMRTFVRLWAQRLSELIGGGTLDRRRAAEEGASLARHLLEMVIRAIDYCPPVEFEFDDFLGALLVSDQELAPDDERGYREAITSVFGSFGITAIMGEPLVASASNQAPSYRNFSYASLRSDPDEAFRFIWDNVGLLDVRPRFYTHVEHVRPSMRVGPRGFVVAETVVDYVQELIISRADLDTLARQDATEFASPASIPADTQLKVWGGGTLIFDEFGGLKFHHVKPLWDWGRQQRRLEFLVRRGLWDTKKRLGFSLGVPLGQRFAQAHEPVETLGEQW